jgi:hypothetical protein
MVSINKREDCNVTYMKVLLVVLLTTFALASEANATKTLTQQQLEQIESQVGTAAEEAIKKSGLDASPTCYLECKLTGWPPKIKCKVKCGH